jgi:hypothetical protein
VGFVGPVYCHSEWEQRFIFSFLSFSFFKISHINVPLTDERHEVSNGAQQFSFKDDKCAVRDLDHPLPKNEEIFIDEIP